MTNDNKRISKRALDELISLNLYLYKLYFDRITIKNTENNPNDDLVLLFCVPQFLRFFKIFPQLLLFLELILIELFYFYFRLKSRKN